MNKEIKELLNTVVENDFCVGCGLCASITVSPFKMVLNENGKYQPVLNDNKGELDFSPMSICPFAKDNNRETEIGTEQFGQIPNVNFDEYSGYFIKSYAGYVKEGKFRSEGSSGGMGNWIATQLLEKEIVDCIIHVKSSNDNSKNVLFNYQISKTVDELRKGAKSKYYPIEMSQV